MSHPTNASRRGFSLIEMLVVIAVLVILVAITVGLAAGVRVSARSSAAADTMRVLDQSVDAWTAASGRGVPKNFTLPTGDVLPAFDGRLASVGDMDEAEFADRSLIWPSLAIYIAAASQEGSAEGVFTALDTAVRSTGTRSVLDDVSTEAAQAELTRVEDPWGNEMRFVHPAYQGGYGDYLNGGSLETSRGITAPIEGLVFRRSWRPFELDMQGEVPTVGGERYFGDADEGICPGGGTRAYFYSAGPDGDPGTVDDNIYTQLPQFPAETADIRSN